MCLLYVAVETRLILIFLMCDAFPQPHFLSHEKCVSCDITYWFVKYPFEAVQKPDKKCTFQECLIMKKNYEQINNAGLSNLSEPVNNFQMTPLMVTGLNTNEHMMGNTCRLLLKNTHGQKIVSDT